MKTPQKPSNKNVLSGLKWIILISLIFIVPGSYQLMLGGVKLRDLFVFKTAVVTDINDLHHGALIKGIFKPVSNMYVESPVTNTRCLFYRLEYFRDTGSTISHASTMVPEELVFQAGEEKFLVSFEEPLAEVILQNSRLFVKEENNNQFIPVKEINLGSKKSIVKEMLMTPDDKIMVFGRLDKIENTTYNGVKLKRLYFVKHKLTGKNFFESYKNVLTSLLLNKNTLYIVSSKTVDETEDLFSYSDSLFSIILGLFLSVFTVILFLLSRVASKIVHKLPSSSKNSNNPDHN